jgi:ABC-type glutathione transport system ATPase component
MTPPIVEARSLRKTYDTGAVRVDALRGLDLALEKGEMVAIMGPSGCGKTTLLNCLSGLDSIDGGEVLIEGTALSEMSDRARTDYRARRMGFVFQFYNLIPAPPRTRSRERGTQAGDRGAGACRSRGASRTRTGRALGWRASARHDRPLARQRPGHRLGRRADG